MNKASNAILALSRAFHGKMLTSSQYDSMAVLPSVNEIAAYLKAETPYGETISSSGVTDFSARGLEELVKKHRFSSFVSLCRFALSIGDEFYRYFIVRDEVDQILRATMLLLGGGGDVYLLRMHPFLDKHLSIDLFALAKAKTPEEIAQSLDSTRYGKLYRACLSAENVSYLTFESAFEAEFDSFVLSLVRRCYRGAEEKALRELICQSRDCRLLERIYRSLVYYPDLIDLETELSPAFVVLTNLNDAQRKRFASCKTKEDFFLALSKTEYRGWLSETSQETVELQLERRLFSLCEKQIRFSTYPSVVMFSYLLLSEIETRNLVRIIEGVKFSVAPDNIRKNLTAGIPA